MQAPLSFLMRIFFFSIPRAVFQQQSRGGLAPVLEDSVGTGKHSNVGRVDDGRISALAVRLTLRSSDEILCADLNVVVGANDKRWAVVGVSTVHMMRSSMNFENRWVLRFALNFASDGEVVRECFSVSGQIHSIDARRMMVGAMEVRP
ncbi:hypothetical protein HELRODRAFT_181880 [Helobdella robusta]|uniref:Secreted protein n=1 Tax=Helobdella robusta TaxID=6412 RepID=T1FHF2_HELRO|nr:hypothetical protein HELRODRAFT_181880 [Helobdella robusta]ESN91958.1 hypothetical protein HELRODRAFT_181880 [Helobdella robusta]